MISRLAASGVALGSALSYAVAGVAQHRAARQAPAGRGLHLKLVVLLTARPLWMAGLLAETVALALHAAALSGGELALVQPLLVSGLLFALPASVLLDHRRPSLAEWSWGLTLVAALALFLAVAQPSAGHAASDTDRLGIITVAGAALASLAVVVATRGLPRQRAAILGFAGGIAFGLTAALLKEAAAIGTGPHPSRLVTFWPIYALVVIGSAGLILNQAAYQAGPLAASLPSPTMVNPLVAIAAGLLVFDERLTHNASALAIEAFGFVVMTVAVVQLARRAVRDEPPPSEQTRVVAQ